MCLTDTCACRSKFNLLYTLPCKIAGLATIRHNQTRNITAKLLKQICSNVQVKPEFQQLSEEQFEA